jgi:acetyl-CoA decarbonylase/synthase complex subunit beta
MDPDGPIFPIAKGEYLDPEHGEYAGVNDHASSRSMGEINRVWLYSAFGYPHTSCGCFEAIAFYIPEVEGFGIVHRRFAGSTVNGLPFSTLADSTAGGRQVDGFHGISLEYMRSVRFLQADGGWNCVVWMPAEIKEQLAGVIPEEIAHAIATEQDAMDIDSLRSFLSGNKHPVVLKWSQPEESEEPTHGFDTPSPVMSFGELPLMAGGVKIILKNAKIYAERVIIQPAGGNPRKPGGKDV